MRRTRRAAVAALATTLLLVTAGCSGDDEPGAEGSPSPSTSGEPAAYAVALEILKAPAPTDQPSDASPPPPTPGAPMMVMVTNTGTKKDTYLLRLQPPDVGGVVPEVVELAPGKGAAVRISMAPTDPELEVRMIAISRGEEAELATLPLPALEAP